MPTQLSLSATLICPEVRRGQPQASFGERSRQDRKRLLRCPLPDGQEMSLYKQKEYPGHKRG